MTNQPERRFVMGRKANQDRIKAAEKAITATPGQRAGHYARQLGCHRETFNEFLNESHDVWLLLWYITHYTISLQKERKWAKKT
jgi:hypothetical protein